MAKTENGVYVIKAGTTILRAITATFFISTWSSALLQIDFQFQFSNFLIKVQLQISLILQTKTDIIKDCP